MVAAKQTEDDNFHLNSESSQQSKCSGLSFNGIKVPVYNFGSQFPGKNRFFLDHCSAHKEEESVLDSLLLAQWEDRTFKGHFKYDVTTSEIKVINGRRKFIAQLNDGPKIPHLPEYEKENLRQMDQVLLDWLKDHDKLLFCVAKGEKASSELIPRAAVPSNAVLTILNATPIEYGHIFLVPCGSYSLSQFLNARSLDMLTRVAVDMNNCSFRLFYDYRTPSALSYFEGFYFSNPLSVELMPVVSFYYDGLRGIRVSYVIDYPIKTLLFERNHDTNLMVKIVAELFYGLQEMNIPYNLLITDCGKKIFLFLQMPNPSNSGSISAWECGGYFLFKSKSEFDQVTEDAMLKQLSIVSLSDSGFQAVKQLCCSIAKKNHQC